MNQNLSPIQFPVKDLLAMRSYEGRDYVGPGATVADRIAQIRSENNERTQASLAYHREHWDAVRQQPVRASGDLFIDGHHRVLVAQERGETHLPVVP